MRRFPLVLLVLLFMAASALAQPASPTTGQHRPLRLVGYFFGKSARTGFSISSAPLELLTEVIYSNARPDADGNCKMSYPDVDSGNLMELRAFRESHPQFHILLSVGGWSGSPYFSEIAASRLKTLNFAASCTQLVREYGLDGLDIDWEHPVNDGRTGSQRRPKDRENYVLLLKAARLALDEAAEKHLLLTVASAGYFSHLPDFAVGQMTPFVDWFNLMTYDLNDMNPGYTSHASALYAWKKQHRGRLAENAPANADVSVRWYLRHGVPAEKIVLGAPFYGHKWTGVKASNRGLFQPFTVDVTTGDGLPYRVIAPMLRKENVFWDDQAKASWFYDARDGVFISFDDARALKAKADYALGQHLGGIMFWELTEDDAEFSLIKQLHHDLIRTHHLIQ